MVQREAMMLSFTDIFRWLSLMFIAMLPLLLLMRSPKRERAGPGRLRCGALAALRIGRWSTADRVARSTPIVPNGLRQVRSNSGRPELSCIRGECQDD
jgi:hypothetical protein